MRPLALTLVLAACSPVDTTGGGDGPARIHGTWGISNGYGSKWTGAEWVDVGGHDPGCTTARDFDAVAVPSGCPGCTLVLELTWVEPGDACADADAPPPQRYLAFVPDVDQLGTIYTTHDLEGAWSAYAAGSFDGTSLMYSNLVDLRANSERDFELGSLRPLPEPPLAP